MLLLLLRVVEMLRYKVGLSLWNLSLVVKMRDCGGRRHRVDILLVDRRR